MKKADFQVHDVDAALSAASAALEGLGFEVQSGGEELTAWESTEARGADPARLAAGDPRAEGAQFLGLRVTAEANTLTMSGLTTGRRGGFVGVNRINRAFRRARRTVGSALRGV